MGASRPCSNATCWRLAPCPAHPPRVPFASAGRSSNLYATPRWKRERVAFLAVHRTCACGVRATVVDHEPPHRGDEAAFWDRSTWVAMCWPDHQRKTGRETRARANAT